MARAPSTERRVPIGAYFASVSTKRKSQGLLVDAARNLVPGEGVGAAFPSCARDAGTVERVL
jgi:hypothetical protein